MRGTIRRAPNNGVDAIRIPVGLRWSSVRAALPSVLVVGWAVGTVIAAVGAIFVFGGTRPMQYLDDPAVVMQGSPFAGSVSLLGNFLWVAAATAALMAVTVTRGRPDGRRSLLLAIGIGSLLLGFDDQFMVHERLLQGTLGLGELWLTGPIAGAALWVAIRHRNVILGHPDAAVLILGAGLLALSLAIDVLKPGIPGRPTLEEAVKLAGIAFWCLFTVRAAIRLIRDTASAIRPARE